jgi:hypothetical protein
MAKDLPLIHLVVNFVKETGKSEADLALEDEIDLHYGFSFLEDELLLLHSERPDDCAYPSQEYRVFLFEEGDARIHLLMHDSGKVESQLRRELLYKLVEILRSLAVIVLYSLDKSLKENWTNLVLCLNLT